MCAAQMPHLFFFFSINVWFYYLTCSMRGFVPSTLYLALGAWHPFTLIDEQVWQLFYWKCDFLKFIMRRRFHYRRQQSNDYFSHSCYMVFILWLSLQNARQPSRWGQKHAFPALCACKNKVQERILVCTTFLSWYNKPNIKVLQNYSKKLTCASFMALLINDLSKINGKCNFPPR